MTTLTGQKRQGRIILLILLASFIIDKCIVGPLLPGASGLIGINPMPVFLDIPVDLSLSFGLLSVPVLFILLYASFARSLRLWTILTALLAIPLYMFIGGILYSLAHDQLPKHMRNAIESFGINLDIYSIFPGYELIHLRGSMIMLFCFFIGLRICILSIRRAARNTRPQPVRQEMPAQAQTPVQSQVPAQSQMPVPSQPQIRPQMAARSQTPARREETISYLGTCVHEGAVVPRQQPDIISEIPQPIRLR